MRVSALCLLLSCLLNAALPARAAEPMSFIHPPPENASDKRHTYYWEILEAALQSNRSKYGDYKVMSYGTPMNFQRAAAEVEAGEKGRINIVSRATNLELEERLRAIPIPLDKGLLGYRMFLVMPETQTRLDKVQTLEELKQLTIGQASVWTDTKILGDNNFKLVLADNYEGLFQMLGVRRYDLFSRGAIEIHAEWLAHKDKIPGLAIEKKFVLAYPMPRYFFVPRNKDGEKMAERIEDGLRRLAKSGEFERRYQAYKKLVLADLDLSGRKVFRLTNTQLSDKAPPLTDKFWWDDLAAELAPSNRTGR
ncbi:type 2 periplasmic-binding domain-containing protein [Uliginosibacterium aquaticum]|uniref:Solute-binding protein family 3/N-terminal domain-containing protein n=1 Tax=Uliginosibacterium aquaticum TaxID=2731212 RepID=A0ABX2ICJ6_9RHOO|nr:hypothetical protein [Uliginosibacterium aquaticum]NSL53722.1 hypothetical protein [Uliginosibacterium aquaticum]